MYLDNLRLQNFRNYKDCTVALDGAKNIFLIGENGQGKTNFLEALYYISYASSFRGVKNDILVHHDADFFSLSANFQESYDGENLGHSLSIAYKEKKNT